ncbi:MAG: 50S ribosomal protein L1 [Candidatus Aenigmarchaeota archaeon]|nr:50S ribosomal protein L1 [Candidatus Aenigmarchaeota archaeon]
MKQDTKHPPMRKEITLSDAIQQLRTDAAGKRKFTQSFDLIINLRNIDLKKPENKFAKDVILPHARGKDVSVGILSENEGMSKAEIEAIAQNKKQAKGLAKKYDYFLADPALMPVVGKTLGRYLGPRGKMPKPLAPNMNKDVAIKNLQKTIRIQLRDSPTIQASIGTEQMDDKQITENAEMVVAEVKKALPGKAQVSTVLLKLTMSKPCKVKL